MRKIGGYDQMKITKGTVNRKKNAQTLASFF